MAFVIGTAGHVDHGKSALVKALTGIDPDRLTEEKERGMTIDLGFAWLILPSGREVSIIDVPGHEQLIKNMLAGVGGIDVALLVIAADEGVMPQTREHLAILDLLGIDKGIVALTKKDLVDSEWLELVTLDIREIIAKTSLSRAAIISVSAITKEGLDILLAAIDELLNTTSPRKNIGRPRLPIDRVFTLSGFGTVVTGTLIDGQLSLGQEIEIVPPGLKGRIRGLQTHMKKVDVALPGSRVAVNLSGVNTSDMERGEVLTLPGLLVPVAVIDAKLRLLDSLNYTIRHNASVTFFTGSAKSLAKVRLLNTSELKAGETGWVQILLDSPITMVKGDRFIIRSTSDTLGGGEIVETQARRHRRFSPTVIDKLADKAQGDEYQVIFALLSEFNGKQMFRIQARSGFPVDKFSIAIEKLKELGNIVILGDSGRSSVIYTVDGWNALVKKLEDITSDYHRQFHLNRGIPKEELRSRLKMEPVVYNLLLQRLLPDKKLVEDGNFLRLPGFTIALSAQQKSTVEVYLNKLRESPYSPPSELEIEPQLLDYLIDQKKAVRVADNVVFFAPVYDDMVRRVKDYIGSKGKITVAEVRDIFNTSRKYALALMEYLDKEKVTRRVGDERVLR